ncbi:MAG: carbohydrate ABC transporter permease [Candidatus Thorarchaeota archaeon]
MMGVPTVSRKQFEINPPTENRFIGGMIVPAALIFLFGILFPVVTGLVISFTDSSAINGYFGKQITLVNYYELIFYGGINGRDFWQFTYQTLFFSFVAVTLEFLLGLGFALMLNKEFRGRGIARATLLIPWALPTIASATIFRYEIFETLDSHGVINNILAIFGLRPITFFGSDVDILFQLPVFYPFDPFLTSIPITFTMVTAIAIDVWKTTPFFSLLILAALQVVPEDLYSAADIAGASNWEKFRHITWPLIKPGVGIALVFRIMDAIRVYDAIVVFRDESVRSMTYQAVDFWARSQEYGLASAVAVIEFLLIIFFALLVIALTRRQT